MLFGTVEDVLFVTACLSDNDGSVITGFATNTDQMHHLRLQVLLRGCSIPQRAPEEHCITMHWEILATNPALTHATMGKDP